MTSRILTTRSPRGRLLTVQLLETCPSTGAYLEEIAKHEGQDGYIVVSDGVSAATPALPPPKEDESTLHVSILLRPALPPARCMLLPLLASTAVARTVAQHSTCEPRIRWASDVYDGSHKLSEVVLRSALHPSGAGFLYIIVNIALRITDDFAGTLPDIVRSVFSNRRTTLTERIADTMIREFFTLYEELAPEGEPSFLREYRDLSLLIGRRVKVLRNGHRLSGTAVSVDDGGHLLVALRRGDILPLHSVAELYDKRKLRLAARWKGWLEQEKRRQEKRQQKKAGSENPEP